MPLAKLKNLAPKTNPEAEREKSFSSSGVLSKQAGCDTCQFRNGGEGFCADYVPSNPRIGLMLPFPTGDDVLEQRPWAGKVGWYWTKKFLEPLGLRREDVLISHALRCRPKGWPTRYPIGPVKRSAEMRCRQYDNKRWSPEAIRNTGGLVDWDPNIFIITFHPGAAREVPAYERLILSDLQRAVKKADQGYRPLVLCGTEVMELVAPWLSSKGGAHDWRAHFWEGSWPWKEIPEDKTFPMFSEPPPLRLR